MKENGIRKLKNILNEYEDYKEEKYGKRNYKWICYGKENPRISADRTEGEGVKELHFKYEGFVGEQANDYVTKLNMGINKLIAEKVDEDTKVLQETIKFLIQDNTKRYALTRVFGILLVISIIIIFTILSSAEYK